MTLRPAPSQVLHGHRCLTAWFTACLQKAAFWLAKAGLLQRNSWLFTTRKVANGVHPQFCWIKHNYRIRPRRGRIMRNRMCCDRRERNLRYAETLSTVLEEGERHFDIRPLRGRCRLPFITASSASLHMRLHIIGRLLRPFIAKCHPTKLRKTREGRPSPALPVGGSMVADF